MILPSKHIPTQFSLIGIGATILKHLEQPKTVSSVWDGAKDEPGVVTYERFTLALDLLFALGMIDYSNGLLTRGCSD